MEPLTLSVEARDQLGAATTDLLTLPDAAVTAGELIRLRVLHRTATCPEAEQIAETLHGFREAGFRHFLASLHPCTPETIAAYGRIIELVG